MKTYFPFLTVLLLLLSTTSYSQKYVYDVNRTELHDDMTFERVRRIIRLPSVNGLTPLKCDFHIHTVFSDGDVWPTARVKEAWMDGLDAMAITDHTSATPSKKNLSGGPNNSYEIAKPEAERLGMILVQATEISRDKPEGGHLNALFITDATKTLDVPTETAVKEAVKQGGYIIWNHPGWAIDTCKSFDVNDRLVKSGDIQAVEVFNEAEWYPRALSWCRDMKLAPIANTDIHTLNDNFYRISDHQIRPMTIVLAREKTQEALKEALFKHTTIAFFKGMLAGDSGLLTDFFFASVKVRKVGTTFDRDNKAINHYVINNSYDIPYVILPGNNSRKITIHPNAEIIFSLPAEIREWKVDVINVHTYEYETLKVAIKLPE
jgi:predicted metal-dependent phosphoesterase TrpH